MVRDSDCYSKIFLSFLQLKIKSAVENLEQTKSFSSLSVAQSFVIFFMLSPLNLQSNRQFIIEVFQGDSDFFHKLTDIFLNMKIDSAKNDLLEMIQNIFFNDYKSIFSKNGLIELFSDEMINFTSKFTSMKSNLFQTDVYGKMYNVLKNFEISYENFFSNNSEIPPEERPTYKLKIAQSVIRVAFSHKKKSSIPSKEDEFDDYLTVFLRKVVEKDISETRKKYCDDYKTLFRKEDLCDDIIKYTFFLFGNETLVEAFLYPYNKFVSEIEDKENFNKEEFITLMDTLIKNVKEYFPLILKIVLKLVQINVKKYYTIEDDNYSPLYTLFFFNFIMTPRMQIVHGLDPKNEILRKLNRVIRNCCFNTKFNDSDPLKVFNDVITDYFCKLKDMMKEFMDNDVKDEEHIKKFLKNFYIEDFIEYPMFLFYNDSKFLCDSIEGGVRALTYFESISEMQRHTKKQAAEEWVEV